MGARGPAPKKAKGALKFTPGVPPPPEWLDERAVTEYNRVSVEMKSAGEAYLQQVDWSDLMTYAQAFSDVARLTVIVREEGETLTSLKGGSYPNPNNNALAMAYNRMTKAASRLGFSPADRSRINVSPTSKDKNPLADLLTGK